MTTISVLGSTGSIGTQTFDVVRAEPDRYRVVAIAAGTSVGPVVDQVREFAPQVVVMATADAAAAVAEAVGASVSVHHGPEALADAARMADVAVNGVVGFAGLPVTLAALEAGKRLALANKESLIAAGPVVQRVRRTPGAELVPVDSEHCALHQCLRSNEALADTGRPSRVSRLVLTASGGPFRGRTRDELGQVTVDDALAHPTWSMGPKITVDSSTLMNKGLEVIEARWLFDVPPDRIDIVVHPQSIVHSLVEYRDPAAGGPVFNLSNAVAIDAADSSSLPSNVASGGRSSLRSSFRVRSKASSSGKRSSSFQVSSTGAAWASTVAP